MMHKLLRVLGYICVLPLIASAAIYLLLATPSVQIWVAAQFNSILLARTGKALQVERISYQFPLTLILHHLQWKDANPISISLLEVTWSPAEWMQKRILA